jgi:pterin-4a-carbinolamine dehydratase
MKVIFLDNDGVICLANNWGSRHKKQKEWGGMKLSMRGREIPLEYRFDNFDQKAVKVLNEILEQTDAEIVVSSDWRLHANLEELHFELEFRDYYKPLIYKKHCSLW